MQNLTPIRQAEHENSMLFHENPYTIEEMAVVEPKPLAKPAPLELSAEQVGMTDPFLHLMPAHLHRAIAQHRDRVVALVKQKEAEVNERVST